MKLSHCDPFEHLRLLLPKNKDLFSIKEVAKIINKSPQFTRDAFRNGKILGYALKGRSLNKPQDRCAYLIHKDDIILYLLQHANHSPEERNKQMKQLLIKGSESQLKYFQKAIQTELEKRTQKSSFNTRSFHSSNPTAQTLNDTKS